MRLRHLTASIASAALGFCAVSPALAQQIPSVSAPEGSQAREAVRDSSKWSADHGSTPAATLLQIPLSGQPATSAGVIAFLGEFDPPVAIPALPLRLEFIDAEGVWQLLRRVEAAETAEPVRVLIEVPASAVHHAGELRLVGDSPESAAWRVVRAVVAGGVAPIAIGVRPTEAAELRASPRDVFNQDSAEPGDVLYYESGRGVTLIAPQRSGEFAFDRFVIDDRPGAIGQNVLDLIAVGRIAVAAEYGLIGDLNNDARIDRFDLEAFVLALVDPAGYAELYPGIDRIQRGDLNGDGLLNDGDIPLFIDALLGD